MLQEGVCEEHSVIRIVLQLVEVFRMVEFLCIIMVFTCVYVRGLHAFTLMHHLCTMPTTFFEYRVVLYVLLHAAIR